MLLAMILIALLSSCATMSSWFSEPGEDAYRKGQLLIEKGKPEEGLGELERAFRADPKNKEYRATLIRQRDTYIAALLAQADSARAAEHLDLADATYRHVLDFDPNNDRARSGIESVRVAYKHKALIAEAQELLKTGQPEKAQTRLRAVLEENPAQTEAKTLQRQVDERLLKSRETADELGPGFRKTVGLEFRDAVLKSVFEVLSRTSGVNFVFDKDVRPDIRTTVYLRETTIEGAINLILATNQLEKKIINKQTILIFPNTPAKQREYQELVIRTFYLSHADTKQTLNMIKTLVKTRDVYIDEKLNMLTMKDTPDAVRIAEKLVATEDLAEPEVLLEVEVLEIKRARLTELGIRYPSQFTVLNIVPNPTAITTTPGGTTVTTANLTTTTTQLTLANIIHGIQSSQVGIANPALNVRDESSDVSLLANPRIRVKNREKAKILIGDKVPVITTTSTANVGVSESVSYLDIGIKLDVEPNIYLDNEVSMKVGLEVSNIVREVTSATGTLTYQVGTRNADTTLQVKDGETQVLAGLINDEDRRSASKIPGLGEIPLLGRLFSSHLDDKTKTEIVLLITPRIVRNLPQVEAASLKYPAGTDAAVGVESLHILPSASVSIPPRGDASTVPAPNPEVPAESPSATIPADTQQAPHAVSKPSPASPQ